MPRPEVPPGAQRDLVDALHVLHHEAGWPSLRELARGAGCSHTTVSTVFSSPKLPTWAVLELLVEAMGGDVREFHRLWLGASSPNSAPEPGQPIAGRRVELAVVRRHLESGAGLLLVAGEAGIGKTRLVDTAAGFGGDTFVARGACLPLSTQVPLLPVTDMLRAVYDADQGQWIKEGMAECPPYVLASLRRLLPELDQPVGAPAVPDDVWWRQRLFSAVATTLGALARLRPLAVLVEDLHWADSTTLDLLEHLLTAGPGLPLVGTWRQDDPTVPPPVQDWLARVRRLPGVDELELRPLTSDGTAEQLALLTGAKPEPALVDRIHRRTAGQPLFTEQLVAQAGDRRAGDARGADDQQLPGVLADLLDRRLEGLEEPAWRIARALGVADRPVTDALLSEVTRLTAAELTVGLHQLADRRLLHPNGGRILQLRHPLLAEAIRRRLVGPESVDEHRRIATALAGTIDPAPAEVAEHWRRADDAGEEMGWRIRAARAAGERYAAGQEAEQWLRVLELWPGKYDQAGTPLVTWAGAHLAAMDALKASLQFDRAADLSEEATRLLTDVDPTDRAALLLRSADFRGARETPTIGLELVEQALDIYRNLQPSVGYVQALDRQHNLLMMLSRFEDAHRVATAAVTAAESIDVLHLHREMLAYLAWHEAEAGDVARGLRTAAEAHALAIAGSDPHGDISISVFRTDILLRSGGSVDDVESAAAPGLEAAANSGIDNWRAVLVRSNLSEALTRAGFVGRAAALIDPVTEVPFDIDRWALHLERANLDAIRGLHDAARDRLAVLRDDKSSLLYQAGMLEARADVVNYVAMVDLWAGAPERALSVLKPLLDESAGTEAVSLMAQTYVLTARAAADVVEHDHHPGRVRAGHLRDLMDLRARAPVEPFTSTSRADGPAHGASWQAETARLAGQPSLRLWATAASAWDQLGRPHDVAYCRWRGAQVALTTGHGTFALRLLRRATSEAREHVPLLAAITETAQQARSRPQSD